ncbi:MAG: hypothetical protein SWY16_00470 [Cyanobacteriota bacterium]|nr:hypothetical protein [Cyanobacteriota bacterium]
MIKTRTGSLLSLALLLVALRAIAISPPSTPSLPATATQTSAQEVARTIRDIEGLWKAQAL